MPAWVKRLVARICRVVPHARVSDNQPGTSLAVPPAPQAGVRWFKSHPAPTNSERTDGSGQPQAAKGGETVRRECAAEGAPRLLLGRGCQHLFVHRLPGYSCRYEAHLIYMTGPSLCVIERPAVRERGAICIVAPLFFHGLKYPVALYVINRPRRIPAPRQGQERRLYPAPRRLSPARRSRATPPSGRLPAFP